MSKLEKSRKKYSGRWAKSVDGETFIYKRLIAWTKPVATAKKYKAWNSQLICTKSHNCVVKDKLKIIYFLSLYYE